MRQITIILTALFLSVAAFGQVCTCGQPTTPNPFPFNQVKEIDSTGFPVSGWPHNPVKEPPITFGEWFKDPNSIKVFYWPAKGDFFIKP